MGEGDGVARMEWGGEGWSGEGRDGVGRRGMEWGRRDGVGREEWGGEEWGGEEWVKTLCPVNVLPISYSLLFMNQVCGHGLQTLGKSQNPESHPRSGWP